MTRKPVLAAVAVALACAGCGRASAGGPPDSAIKSTIDKLYPGTGLVKERIDFQKIQVGPRRVAHTDEIYGIPGGTAYWNVLTHYVVRTRNNAIPSEPSCTAQQISQLYIARKSDFGDWAISMVSGPENHEGDEKQVPCQS